MIQTAIPPVNRNSFLRDSWRLFCMHRAGTSEVLHGDFNALSESGEDC
jgi:hypothetical protein